MQTGFGMNISFDLEPHYFDPFYHGFGPFCAVKSSFFAFWKLHVKILYDREVKIPFYICEGNRPLLLGNNVIHNSTFSEPHNVLTIPADVAIVGDDEVSLPLTHNVQCTHFVLTYISYIHFFAASHHALLSPSRTIKTDKTLKKGVFSTILSMFVVFQCAFIPILIFLRKI